MTWRELRKSDLGCCLELEPGNWGDNIVGRQVARGVWEGLLENPVFHGIVVESDPPILGRRIVACGAGIFVAPDIITAEIAQPKPGLNSRIVSSIASGHSVLLPQSEIGRLHAGPGIDVASLMGSWLDGLGGDQSAIVTGLLVASFLSVYRGFKLNRVLRECACEKELNHIKGLFQVIAHFPPNRCAALLTKEIASSVPYSAATLMFEYKEPVLHLTESDQRLLIAALTLQTDEELSSTLNVSVPAIKKRWRGVFEKFEGIMPQLTGPDVQTSVRGRQKRHHVLSYLKEHPEELRPFAQRSRASANGG